MIQKRDTSTLLRRLSPGSKLLLALAGTLAVIFFENIWFSIAVMLISYAVILYEKMGSMFKLIFVSTVSMFVFMYAIYGAVVQENQKDTYIGTYLGIPYYQAGIDKATHFFFRIAPLMAFLFLIFRTINMTDLGVWMTKAGLPYKWAFIFTDSFMVIPVLSKDMEQIMDAQRARGLVTEGNLMTRMKAFVPVIVPVVANAFAKVQDQAIAMDTKGFNSKCKKTVYRELPNTKEDKLCKALSLLLLVAAVAYKVLKSLNKI
ncbi:MAG: energy-coupling factor transporter transmembrane protein EcfT [Oscillospiraceae bacterium]|nr:energy-coupling factor transporter transmembrane protein EcfT [Oscillospiraceae bacterium]